jgi:exopolysaccharide biosynthesis WecB/TagA/CpsF family protein
MDRVILGDNQFFGINHMSEDKAQAQAERFQKLDAIIDVIDIAYDAGIRGFMFNTHDRVADICDYFRSHPTRYADLRLYPSMPYAHKYANAVNEIGLIGALNQFVFGGGTAGDAASTMVRGGLTVVKRDLMDVMRILIDLEMKMFRDLNVQAVFLQNIVTDLLLGFKQNEVFSAFNAHIRDRYGVDAAFNTMNMPALVELLEGTDIENPLICSSVNSIGYLMSPDVHSYEETLARSSFRPMAMSILASGAVPVKDAVKYVVDAGVESIVFGASSKNHIVDTKTIIENAFEARETGISSKRPPRARELSRQLQVSAPVTVMDIPVHSVPRLDVLQCMDSNIRGDRESQHISITNTESMYHALRLPEHRHYISDAAFSLCDGMGVVVAGRAGGKKIRRFNGPVLVEEAVRFGQDKEWRHFFCGGKEGVADAMSEKLKRRFPKMIVAGTYSPPFRDLTISEEKEMIDQINTAKPDILWVGLGLLKQEAWIAQFKDKLDVPWVIGIGAAFDYHSGTAKRAPKWARNIGLEWLFRLFNEPRMLNRNFYSFVFMTRALVHELKHRKSA